MTKSTVANKYQVHQVELVPQQVVRVKTQANTIYQLFNDKKQRITPKKSVKNYKDLWVYNEESDAMPSLILEDYYQHTAIVDGEQLSQLDATFATTSDVPVAYMPQSSGAMPVSSADGMGWKIGLGALGLASAGVAVASKRDSDKEKNKAGQAEADKLKAEQDKAKAEADKAKAEQDKAQAEADKAKAEQDKAQAEADKLKAEQDKAKAEADKVKAEQDKAQAEADKLKAEQDKAKAEADKVKAEQDKAQAEADKVKAEQDKAQAEADKLKAEQDKAQAEADKAKAEQDKAQAEADKAKAEQDKAQAEAGKLKAEQDKAKAEADKVKAEQDKAKAEQDKAQAEADKVKAEQDKAQAEETLKAIQAEQEKYLQNNPPKIKFDDITQDNIINQTEANSPEVKISGSVSNLQKGDILTIKIGDTSHQVSVTQGDFSLNVDGSILRNKPALLAEVMRNGEKVAEKTHSYKVDTEISTPVITFNSITDDNVINANESREKAIEVSGSVTHFNTGEQLMVKIGDADAKRVAIQDDGAFSFWVAGQTLAQHPVIQATLTTQDDAGNTATALATAEYTVDTAQPTPTSLTLGSITGDNFINVTEKSQQEITISGAVSGTKAHMHKGQTVSMQVNGQTVTAQVENDLTFKLKVKGEDLIKHEGYRLVATLTEDGQVIESAVQQYNVADDAIAKIHLNDVSLGLAEEIGTVRLSGKLDFTNSDSMYKWGHNKDFIHTIVLKIGEQEISTGILHSDYSFNIDLTREQYANLKGQEISHILKATGDFQNWLPSFDYNSNTPERWVNVSDQNGEYAQAELAKIKVVFDDVNIETSKQLNVEVNSQTEISGRVTNAKVNDNIDIQIGAKTYKTNVKNDLSFSIKVDNVELNHLDNIQAQLKTANAKGEQVTVSDVATVLQNANVGSDFVSPHEHIKGADRIIDKNNEANNNFPYFVHAMTPYNAENWGFLNKIPFGGTGEPVTIKYYFATQEDYDNGLKPFSLENMVPFTEKKKEDIRKVYRALESVTNVKFVETLNKDEADSKLTLGDNSGEWKDDNGNPVGFVGYASAGGDSAYLKGLEDLEGLGIHEILHTLGAAHTQDILQTLEYGKHEFIGELSSMSGGKDTLLRLFDLAYLHYRFGVNPNQKTGDDIYSFKTYTANKSDGDIYIWDGAGTDTFDASNEKVGVHVNLTPGSWIYRGEKSDSLVVKDKTRINNNDEVNKFFPEFPEVKFVGNINYHHDKVTYAEGQAFIGYGTQLENLIGSAHNDVLAGNKADNNIFGGAGNDQISGDDGNDYLDGGLGADTLTGGLGNDIYVVDNAGDHVTELANQGTDSVYAHVDYRLSDFVENLSLFGNAINGTGNALNNSIQGNDLDNVLDGGAGNDRLNGGRGSDTLTGGVGHDTFVFNSLLDGSVDKITDFTLSEDKFELSQTIFAGLTQANLSERVKYNQENGELSYDADGKGSADAVHFATLLNKPTLNIDETHFTII